LITSCNGECSDSICSGGISKGNFDRFPVDDVSDDLGALYNNSVQ